MSVAPRSGEKCVVTRAPTRARTPTARPNRAAQRLSPKRASLLQVIRCPLRPHARERPCRGGLRTSIIRRTHHTPQRAESDGHRGPCSRAHAGARPKGHEFRAGVVANARPRHSAHVVVRSHIDPTRAFHAAARVSRAPVTSLLLAACALISASRAGGPRYTRVGSMPPPQQ